jgi:hypothetical protein
MNRREYWLAACVLALAAGVGIGRGQEPAQEPELIPPPRVLFIPPVPPALAVELAGLEAAGCKSCTQASATAKAKCQGCSGCSDCSCCQEAGCCDKCGKKKKTDKFASESVPAKKSKKSKKHGVQDFIMVAVPPPPMPPMPVCCPPMASCPYCSAPAMAVSVPSMPAPPMMVFRAAASASECACSEGRCGSFIQQTKHETDGKINVEVHLGVVSAGGTIKSQSSAGQLEIDCGAGCTAMCERMSLQVPGGQKVTIATSGKQVTVEGPSFRAICDTLARDNSGNCMCLMLQGHVRLHQSKSGSKTEIESEQVRLVVMEGLMEIHTVCAP